MFVRRRLEAEDDLSCCRGEEGPGESAAISGAPALEARVELEEDVQ